MASAAVAAGRTGLLVVDMVRALADPAVEGHDPTGAAAAGRCRAVLASARAAGVPVWFTRGGRRWHTSTGSPLRERERGGWLRRNGWIDESPEQAGAAMAITPQLAPEPDEVVISKSKPSAFFGTPLVAQLLAARVDTLVVTGMMTSGCVRATVTDAFSYDLDVVVPVECVADRNPDAHRANLDDIGRKYAVLCDTDQLLAELGDIAAPDHPAARTRNATPDHPAARTRNATPDHLAARTRPAAPDPERLAGTERADR